MTITISTNAAALANTTLATRAIHAGQEPDPTTGAVVTPIYMTSTFKQDGVGGLRNGYDYSRSVNPTRNSFDAQLAAVEGAKYALSFSSGLAAIDVLLRATLKPGDNILLGEREDLRGAGEPLGRLETGRELHGNHAAEAAVHLIRRHADGHACKARFASIRARTCRFGAHLTTLLGRRRRKEKGREAAPTLYSKERWPECGNVGRHDRSGGGAGGAQTVFRL